MRGIWTITGAGRRYPERPRARLGDAASAVLHGVGDDELLRTDGVAVIGSRNVTDDGARIAREIAQAAARSGPPDRLRLVTLHGRGCQRTRFRGRLGRRKRRPSRTATPPWPRGPVRAAGPVITPSSRRRVGFADVACVDDLVESAVLPDRADHDTSGDQLTFDL